MSSLLLLVYLNPQTFLLNLHENVTDVLDVVSNVWTPLYICQRFCTWGTQKARSIGCTWFEECKQNLKSALKVTWNLKRGSWIMFYSCYRSVFDYISSLFSWIHNYQNIIMFVLKQPNAKSPEPHIGTWKYNFKARVYVDQCCLSRKLQVSLLKLWHRHTVTGGQCI